MNLHTLLKNSPSYLTTNNARRVDYIRDKIQDWFDLGLINERENAYLITSLVEAISNVSNTTGTYGAFLKHWDKRALKSLSLEPLYVVKSKYKGEAYNLDAIELVKKIRSDIIYLDPPYNNRQYASNYHLLENVARNDKPSLKGKTKIFDWADIKSKYSQVRNAKNEFSELLHSLQGKHLLISYNTEGIVSIDDLVSLVSEVAKEGTLQVWRIPFRKYKSKIPSASYDLEEILIYCQLKNNGYNKELKSKQVEYFSEKLFDLDLAVSKNKLIKSPVNYIGGKYKLLPQILPIFPKNIDTFVDLFSGAANVGINVTAKKYIFNDMNSRINEMFRFFQASNPTLLIDEIKTIIEKEGLSKTNEDAYVEYRKKYNENPDPLSLYILASFGYNYQFRFNNSMQFNNPFGRNRSHFSSNMERNLLRFIQRIQSMDAVFTDQYFEEFDTLNITEKDFVYLDPPYLITTGSYNDGNRGFKNWGIAQEKKLLELLDDFSSRGVRYALSNVLYHKGNQNELLIDYTRERNLDVHTLKHSYNNSSYNTRGGESIEVLITNY